jgi:hypothetical protein
LFCVDTFLQITKKQKASRANLKKSVLPKANKGKVYFYFYSMLAEVDPWD